VGGAETGDVLGLGVALVAQDVLHEVGAAPQPASQFLEGVQGGVEAVRGVHDPLLAEQQGAG